VESFCEHGNEPSGSIKYWKFLSACITGSFIRRAQFHEVSWIVQGTHVKLGMSSVINFWILSIVLNSVILIYHHMLRWY
jgi:hypothetical protein